MYHVTKNNNIAKELNFFPEVRSVTFVKNSDTIPIVSFETQQDWEAWLKENHTETKGIWLKIAKKVHSRLRFLMPKPQTTHCVMAGSMAKKLLLTTSIGYKNLHHVLQKASGQK